jgi:hypothetical protein
LSAAVTVRPEARGQLGHVEAGSGNVKPISQCNKNLPSWAPADPRPAVAVLTDDDKAKHAAAMSPEALCQHIESVLAPARNALTENLPYIAEAQKRFSQPGRRIPVHGKPTWGEWIQTNLGVSDRHVRRLLALYRDPTKKKTKSKQQRDKKTTNAFLALAAVRLAKLVLAGNIDQAKIIALTITDAQKKSPASIPAEVLQSVTVATCRGCDKLHAGILNVAKGHPDWDINRVSEYCAVSTVVVRQAAARFGLAVGEGKVA